MSASAVADTDSSVGDPADHPGPGRAGEEPWPLPVGVALGAVSGFVLTEAFPGALDWWPLAMVAVAGLVLATRGRRARAGALVGFAFGLAFFIPHLHWSGIYVGLLPWMALATASSAFIAALGALLPGIWRVPGGVVGTTLAGSGLWVAMEFFRDRIPFGGFPWGRLGFSQSGAPTAGLAALGGVPLVTFATAAVGTLIAWAVVRAIGTQASEAASTAEAAVEPEGEQTGADAGKPAPVVHARFRSVSFALVTAAVVTAAGLAVPLPTDGKMVRVAAVQGNTPDTGLEFNAERRAVLDNHVNATLGLAERVKAGTAKQPDLVLWPENASDIDPLRNPDAAERITEAADAIKVPLLVGTVLEEPVNWLSNASLVWGPENSAHPGPGQRYVKRHPAPFAEYIPYRSFFRHFSDKVDLVRTDIISGNKLRANPVGVLTMGPAKVGDVICFEVAYDSLVRDPVKQGADILAVQTNNATFGLSDESVQQLAMSRLRAIETGRSVVHVSTVGVSAIILPNGTVLQRTGLFRQSVLEADVPLRTSLTVATRVGEWPEGILTVLGLGLVLAGSLAGRTRQRRALTVRTARP